MSLDSLLEGEFFNTYIKIGAWNLMQNGSTFHP